MAAINQLATSTIPNDKPLDLLLFDRLQNLDYLTGSSLHHLLGTSQPNRVAWYGIQSHPSMIVSDPEAFLAKNGFLHSSPAVPSHTMPPLNVVLSTAVSACLKNRKALSNEQSDTFLACRHMEAGEYFASCDPLIQQPAKSN